MTIGDFQEKKIQDNGLPLSLKGKQEVNMGGVYNEIHISCFGTIRKAKGPVFFALNGRGFLNAHFSAGIYCPFHVQYPSRSACMLPGAFGNMRIWYRTHAACCAVIKTFVPDPGVSCPLLTLRELVVGHILGCEQDRVSDRSHFSS